MSWLLHNWRQDSCQPCVCALRLFTTHSYTYKRIHSHVTHSPKMPPCSPQISYSEASWTGLMDVRRLIWDEVGREIAKKALWLITLAAKVLDGDEPHSDHSGAVRSFVSRNHEPAIRLPGRYLGTKMAHDWTAPQTRARTGRITPPVMSTASQTVTPRQIQPSSPIRFHTALA